MANICYFCNYGIETKVYKPIKKICFISAARCCFGVAAARASPCASGVKRSFCDANFPSQGFVFISFLLSHTVEQSRYICTPEKNVSGFFVERNILYSEAAEREKKSPKAQTSYHREKGFELLIFMGARGAKRY